ncbi:MAG TPA: lysophospholipid acyltransferase family protein [Planctomycetota bacterium]|nr:lysophospholipid acyltransferase family protein [Planctomycetota bacterium]
MSTLRALVRLFVIFVTTLSLFAFMVPARLCVGARSPRGLHLRRWFVGRWSRVVLWMMGAKLEVSGPVPPAPCVLVSNHLGYVDILVLGASVDTLFVSKAEVRNWPLIGKGAAAFGTIFLDREARRQLPTVNAEIHAALEKGDRVLFFPEGTSTGGSGILPFKSSLLEPAARSGYPVFCAAVHYSTSPGDPPASQSVCWWGDMDFTGHLVRLFRLSHFRARVVFHPEPHVGEGRKELAARTERAVGDMLQRLIES